MGKPAIFTINVEILSWFSSINATYNLLWDSLAIFEPEIKVLLSIDYVYKPHTLPKFLRSFYLAPTDTKTSEYIFMIVLNTLTAPLDTNEH